MKLPALFGDHMVLQQEAKLPVWGWADPGEKVTVTIGSHTATTTASTDGRWRIELAPLPAGSAAQTLTFTGKNTLALQDVLVGDVWICAGQSNMAFGAMGAANGKAEVANANDPGIRLFWVTKLATLTPVDQIGATVPERPLYGTWQVCNPKTLAEDGGWNGFSAVGYFFAREVRKATHCPVGMICSAWGGTPAQAWTSLSALEQNPALAHYANDFKNLPPQRKALFPADWVAFDVAARKWNATVGAAYQQNVMIPWRAEAEKAKAAGQLAPAPPPPPPTPAPHDPGNIQTASTLFNGMIAPLIPYAIKGAIWYQGESNDYAAMEYRTLFRP
ncbi:MAG: sialate O-acetylesterase [Verrucomicrobiota bacterium]